MKRTTLLAVTICFSTLAGCVIVPSTKTTLESLGTEESAGVPGPVEKLMLEVTTTPTTLSVRATQKRECERKTLAVTQVTKSKHAKLGGTRDPRGRVFGLLLAPVTIPVSAAVTGLVLATSEDSKVRETKVVSTSKYSCVVVAADVPVRMTLPSGLVADRTTDASGAIELAIPADEPYAGEVIVAAGSTTKRAAYSRPMPAVTAVKETARACATQHKLAGGLVVRVTVDTDGAPRGVVTDAGDRELAACVTNGIRQLRFVDAHRGTTLVFRLPPAA